MQVQFNRKHVKFVFEGHRVKDEVTRAQKRSVVISSLGIMKERPGSNPVSAGSDEFFSFLYLFLLNVYITVHN